MDNGGTGNGKGRELAFALYVHLPFCRRKCAYCDFVSFAGEESLIPGYIDAVLREWEAVKESLFPSNTYRVTSCYLGGGTPSLLCEAQIEALVTGLFPKGVEPSMEFTLEANPESLTASKLSRYRDLGINRLSLGIQSFSDEVLHRLGRVHTVSQAEDAIRMIQKAGWENWSIDLMYGLPDQSPGMFKKDLARALTYGMPHFSAYCLTLSPGTPFGVLASEGKLRVPTENAILEMMDFLEAETAKAGIYPYETSNFAGPGFRCVHNLAYWHLDPYIGLGLGAVSYFVDDSGPWGAHWENPTGVQGYERIARTGEWAFLKRVPLTANEAFMETLLAGLRLTEGLEISRISGRFGNDWVDAVLERLGPLVEEGWLAVEGGNLRATPKGARVLDALLLEVISDLDSDGFYGT